MIHITSYGGKIGNWCWLNASPHEMYLETVFMAGSHARVDIYECFWGQVWFHPPKSPAKK